MIEEEVPETVQGDPEISLEDRGGMIEDDDPETVQDDENGSLEDREVPVVSTTLRPAGFGWQATRNRILGEGVSPAPKASPNRYPIRLSDDSGCSTAVCHNGPEPSPRPPQPSRRSQPPSSQPSGPRSRRQPCGLIVRGRVFYLRLRVPGALVEKVGRTPVLPLRMSLCDAQCHGRAAGKLNVQVGCSGRSRRFDRLRGKTTSSTEPRFRRQ